MFPHYLYCLGTYLVREHSMQLCDTFGRKINYLRLSITDRCNLRCIYCMPPEGVAKVRHEDVLTYEQLLQVARAAVAVGVEKIRITGGEPLARKGILPFLERLAQIPGLRRLVLTTNGILLPDVAQELRRIGVESLNISLDSLRPETFHRITRGGDLTQVLAGIAAAERAGFPYIKINVVVIRGLNDGEIADFAALTLDKPYKVRFIEYMPTLKEENWQERCVPGKELLTRLSQLYDLEPAPTEPMAGPASYRRIAGAAGMIGIITPVSCHFCRECNRIRVTSTGIAKSCLFSSETTNLKELLRSGDEHGLQEALKKVVAAKPDRHQLDAAAPPHPQVPMSQVGG